MPGKLRLDGKLAGARSLANERPAPQPAGGGRFCRLKLVLELWWLVGQRMEAQAADHHLWKASGERIGLLLHYPLAEAVIVLVVGGVLFVHREVVKMAAAAGKPAQRVNA